MDAMDMIMSGDTAISQHQHSHHNQQNKPHALAYEFALWITRRKSGSNVSQQYDQNLKEVAHMATVEEFWSVFAFLKRPVDIGVSDIHLFRNGIKPMWEDEANKLGGKWAVRVRKGVTARMWEALCLNVIGDQLNVGDELCGVIVSIRHHDDVISVWNRNAANKEVTMRLRQNIATVLRLPSSWNLEYKAHDDSLRHATAHHTNNNNNPIGTSSATPAPAL